MKQISNCVVAIAVLLLQSPTHVFALLSNTVVDLIDNVTAPLTTEENGLINDITSRNNKLILEVDGLVLNFNNTNSRHFSDLEDRRFRNTMKIGNLMDDLAAGDNKVQDVCVSSTVEDCDLEKSYHREYSKAAANHLNQEIYEILSFLYTGYIEKLSGIHLEAIREREDMMIQIEHMATVSQSYFDHNADVKSFLLDEEERLLEKIDFIDVFTQEVSSAIHHAKTAVFDYVCFQFEGVTGEITTPEDQIAFFTVVGDALDLAYCESGVNMKLVNLQIVDQLYTEYSTDSSLRRRLSSSGSLSVRGGGSWQCQCEYDGPMHDVYRRLEWQEDPSDHRRRLWSSSVEEHFVETMERHMRSIFSGLTSVSIIPCTLFDE